MAMRNYLLLLSCCFLLASCKEGWTDENKTAYLQICLESRDASGLSETKRKAYCDCNLEKVMQHYQDIDEVIVNKDSTQLRAAFEVCKRNLAP